MTKHEDGPDRARSWVIALVACSINTLLSGISRTTGLFYVALIDTYGVSRLQANLPFTLRNVLRNLGGPIAGAIGQRYGPRDVTIAGGVFASLGIILCTFAPNVMWIAAFWGGIHGFGVALGNTLFQATVNQYFVKYRATASGLALSGACVGSFIFPIVLEYMLANIGLSGTFLLTGGFIMHVLPGSIMMNEPSWIRKGVETKRNLGKSGKDMPLPYKKTRAASTAPGVTRIVEEPNMTIEDSKNISVIQMKSIPSCGCINPNTEENERYCAQKSSKADVICKGRGMDNLAFVTSKIDLNEKSQAQEATATEVRLRTISIGEVSMTIPVSLPENQVETSLYKGIIKVARDPMFHMISFSLAAFAMLFDPYITVIVDYLKDKGLEDEMAKYFISVMSLGDLIGRLCLGWVTDRKYLSVPKFMMLLQVVQGLCFILMPFIYTFNTLMAVTVIYGLSSGATLVMFPVLVGKYLVSVQSLAIGCISFFTGLLSFAVPPLIGYFRDRVGSYDNMFYITGGLSVVTGLVWIIEPFLLKLRSRFDKPRHSASILVES